MSSGVHRHFGWGEIPIASEPREDARGTSPSPEQSPQESRVNGNRQSATQWASAGWFGIPDSK